VIWLFIQKMIGMACTSLMALDQLLIDIIAST
jgi:hypothetical protein